MRIRFDPAFDGGTWPGPLERATFGQAWLGPTGLLGRIENALGLGAPRVTIAERASELAYALRERRGFWSASHDVDAFGTAQRLIEIRDQLWQGGWRGTAVSARLRALADATRDLAPGLPDRFEAVGRALVNRSAGIDVVELLDPVESLPVPWPGIMAKLAAGGTRIESTAPVHAEARGDLAGARTTAFEPRGDGSLQLARADGPLAAADDVAAWLASRDDLARTVIINPDGVLDRALANHGLPTLGAPDVDDGEALLEVLPLVVDLGWAPADPTSAFGLLSTVDGPIPRPLSLRLIRALQVWPAVDGDEWRWRLASGLQEIDDAEERAEVSRRIETIFGAGGRRDAAVATTKLRERVRCIARWAEQRGTRPSERWTRVVAQCRTFLALLTASDGLWLSRAEVHRFLDAARAAVTPHAALPSSAGLAHVDRPDAIAGPARVIVWWGFERTRLSVPRLGLSPRERRALEADGVVIANPGHEAVRVARRWRRPLEQAEEALVLVCAQRGADGQARYPHALWDEIEAAATPSARALVRPRPDLGTAAPRTPRPLAPLPIGQRRWSLPSGRDGIGPRAVESPSGLSTLIACSLNWALTHHARLRPGASEPPPFAHSTMIGRLAHAVLERVLAEEPLPDANAAEKAARRIFDREGPRLVAELFLPGAEADRGDVRYRIARSARTLVEAIATSGATIAAVERQLERPAFGKVLVGTPDIVLRDPDAIIDLKWGGRDQRKAQLASGTALQLAAYGFLVAGDARPAPPGAFLILRSQDLLTAGGEPFSRGTDVAGPSADETWDAAVNAATRRHAEIASGTLVAPIHPDEDGEFQIDAGGIEEGELKLTPPCRWCHFDLICGVGGKGGHS